MHVPREGVELRLDTDDGIEAAALLPLLEQVGDAGEGVPLPLEASDQAEATEVRIVVPAGSAFEPRRSQQAPCLVQAHGRRSHARSTCQVIKAVLVSHRLPHPLANGM